MTDLMTFVVDKATGEMAMTITGIKGKACKPIHDAVSADLARELSLPEISSADTAEMDEGGEVRIASGLQVRR